jgi:CRISPR type IV-associated protein Csf1
MIYTSELAAQALRLQPKGQPHAQSPCYCAMCARPIRTGDFSQKKDLGKTFLDFPFLRPSDWICGFCAATTEQSVMRALQRCVITAEGVYPINTDDARAWLWLTPPKPPFAVVINHSTMAAFHYFWRTPVTLDEKLVSMNVDGVIYEVRRSKLTKALEHGAYLIEQDSKLEKKKGALKSPFVVLSRDPSKSARSANGHISPAALALAKTNEHCKEAVDYLANLTPGELIALSPMLKQNPATATQPTIINSLESLS